MKNNDLNIDGTLRESFYATCNAIKEKIDDVRFIIPFIINASYLTEICLKMILKRKGIVFKSHSLIGLFFLLDDKDQNEIISNLQIKLNKDNDEIIKEIAILSYSFKNWRYISKSLACEYGILDLFMNETYNLSKRYYDGQIITGKETLKNYTEPTAEEIDKIKEKQYNSSIKELKTEIQRIKQKNDNIKRRRLK